MKNVTVRLSQEKVDELDDEADELGMSRAEYIRSLIESRHESDEVGEELDRLRDEYEDEIEHLENQVERLQRTNLKILEERDHSTELEVYVSDRKEWERASWLTRQKWRLFGKG